MKKMQVEGNFWIGALVLAATILLQACGGGGSNGNGSVPISATSTTTTQSLTVGTAMNSFSPLTPRDGTPPYTYSIISGTLPADLSLDAVTGTVTGTPTTVYTAANIRFQVQDANGTVASTTSTVIFSVSPDSNTISATANTTAQILPVGVAMNSFSPLTPSGGATHYTFSITSGTLPAGLNLNPSTGAVTGTPTATSAAAYVVFSVKDANNIVASVTSTVSFTAGNWTKQMGGPGESTLAYGTAADSSGNVYVTGYTTGTAYPGFITGGLDGNAQTGKNDFFLTKYDAAGVKIYTKQMGVSGQWTQAASTATDASGNIYVTGYTTGGLDGNVQSGTYDFFLIKYDSTGVKIYTKQMGSAYGQFTWGTGTATDASGNIYVTGHTTGGLDGNVQTGMYDFFLTKYDRTGAKIYTKQVGVSGQSTYAYGTATDASGNVYVTGHTAGQTGTDDFFLVKYDSTGAKIYTKQMGVPGAVTVALGTSTDASGNVYVAGFTTGGLDGNTLTGTQDFFLTKYDSTGVKIYTKQMGVSGQQTHATGTATDASGNVYATGFTTGGLDGNTLGGAQDFFLTKYDSTGVKIYTKQMGVPGQPTYGYGTATDVSGNVYVTGFTTGGLDGNALTGIGDFYLVKYSSVGVRQ